MLRIAGLFISIIGSIVMAGWLLKNQYLVQISPAFEPMKFNTALLFLITGAGLF